MVLYGHPSGFMPSLVIQLPSFEEMMGASLGWEHMDTQMPENFEDINAELEAEAKAEREFKARMRETKEKVYEQQNELFASVGLRPDGRPTLSSMLEQARHFGLARGIGRGLGQEETEEDREEDRRLYEHWRYGVYGKKGLKERQRELMEEERFKFHIKLEPIGPAKESESCKK